MSGETEKDISGWTVDTLHSHLQVQLVLLNEKLDERLRMQTMALDAAFLAQQTAMAAALAADQRAVTAALAAAEKAVTVRQDAQEREFHEHLAQYRHEVDFAFASSDRAITKAEIATEKRFESVNEFRQQLSDQATRFMPRAEAVALFNAMGEKLDALATRIDKSEGRGVGLNAGWVYLLGAIAAIGTIMTIVLIFI